MAGLNPSPLSDKALMGQSVLVTGASRGIGAAIASACLQAGASVMGSYATAPGALEDLSNRFQGRCFAVKADLSDPAAPKSLFEKASAQLGAVTALINNAGIMLSTPLDANAPQWQADWARTFQVNVQALADLCQQFLLQDDVKMKRLINIASRAAFRGDTIDAMHYAASKGAVVSLTRSIARGMAKDGVRAFIIAPGWVKTDMAAVAYEPGNEWMLDEIPVGEAAPPSDIGNLCAFLLTGASDNATGASFDVNGASYVR